ncbi:MAG: hypothetical protein ACFE9C_00350 [Candidatus Hodarchaeota archaeon]
MNEEKMNEEITKIIREAIEQISHSNCSHSKSHCNKDSPDWKPKRIHCGTDRCKGLHQND